MATLFAMLLRTYRRWKAYHQTYAELAALDDRTLADLNIPRSDIAFVARGAARRVA